MEQGHYAGNAPQNVAKAERNINDDEHQRQQNSPHGAFGHVVTHGRAHGVGLLNGKRHLYRLEGFFNACLHDAYFAGGAFFADGKGVIPIRLNGGFFARVVQRITQDGHFHRFIKFYLY